MHSILNALSGPRRSRGGHRSFEVDDANAWRERSEDRQRISRNVFGSNSPRNWAALLLGEPYVVDGRVHIVFVNPRIDRMALDLIDPTAEHHIAGEHHHGFVVR